MGGCISGFDFGIITIARYRRREIRVRVFPFNGLLAHGVDHLIGDRQIPFFDNWAGEREGGVGGCRPRSRRRKCLC